MELRQVRTFVAVVDGGTFTAAAASMDVVQSAVSQSIARLERSLGVTLFDRTGRAPRLTSDGKTFEPHARALLDAETRARAALRPTVGREVRIGVPAGLAPVLADAVARLPHDRLPGGVQIVVAANREDAVASGALDAAVVRTTVARGDLVYYPLPDDELLIAVSLRNPRQFGDPVDITGFASDTLVLAGTGSGSVGSFVVNTCRTAGFEPETRILPDGVDLLGALATTPHAWSVYFAGHAGRLDPKGVGVQFLSAAQSMAIGKRLAVRRDRTDVGARLSAALTTRSGSA